MPVKEHSFFSTTPSVPHEIFYSEWGPENGKPIVCVHGLTGNAYDFDFIARDLTHHGYRVIAIDLPGRGRSDFLKDPMDYNYGQYIHDLKMMLAHLKLDQPGTVDWLGVSLGGLLGMVIASEPGTPIRRLILNDVGPSVPKAALDFIHLVISQNYVFDTIHDLEMRMRATRGLTWGPVTDEQWAFMAKHNARATDDGLITYGYDPRIAEVFKNHPVGDFDLWACWDKIKMPVLVIQGAQSTLLTRDILWEMKTRGPEFDLVVVEGCGHVPSLMAPDQIEVVRQWLIAKSI